MRQGWKEDLHKSKRHYVNDALHNDNGPAIIYADGSKAWFKNGEYHREDGPAIEYVSYSRINEWHYNGEYLGASDLGYTQEYFEIWKRFKAFI